MLDPLNVRYWELAHSQDRLGPYKSSDYSARCDVCGDSTKNTRLKRLHLYTKSSYEGDWVKCFNGDCTQNSSMYHYLKNYHPSLFSSYQQELRSKSLDNLSKGVLNIPEVKDEIKEEIKEEIRENNLVPPPFLFDKLSVLTTPNKDVITYLNNRGFTNEIIKYLVKNLILDISYLNSDILLNKKLISLKNYFVINLKYKEKYYGFYSRSLDKKIFYTYIPEENTGFKVWNYYNIDVNKEVYIFEGIFDALSFMGSKTKQGIAALGSDIDENLLNKIPKNNIIFCFDNDDTGRQKALKYANLGYKILVYPEDVKEKDLNDLLLKTNFDYVHNFVKDNIYEGLVGVIKLQTRL